jgi:hypothetical protein
MLGHCCGNSLSLILNEDLLYIARNEIELRSMVANAGRLFSICARNSSVPESLCSLSDVVPLLVRSISRRLVSSVGGVSIVSAERIFSARLSQYSVAKS